MPVPNDNGRALEWEITRRILVDVVDSYGRDATADHQRRDESKFYALGAEKQRYYRQASEVLLEWLIAEGLVTPGVAVVRLGDDAGARGDVTDVRLVAGNGTVLNLSIKHNSRDVKHLRPRPLAERAGFERQSPEVVAYRQEIDRVRSRFVRTADLADAATFNDVRESVPGAVESLYRGVCEVVVDFLNNVCDDHNVTTLVEFLLSTTDHLQIVVTASSVSVYESQRVHSPWPRPIARLQGDSYVVLNAKSFEIKMRIHTAATKLHNVPLKFAVTLDPSPEPIWSNQLARVSG